MILERIKKEHTADKFAALESTWQREGSFTIWIRCVPRGLILPCVFFSSGKCLLFFLPPCLKMFQCFDYLGFAECHPSTSNCF